MITIILILLALCLVAGVLAAIATLIGAIALPLLDICVAIVVIGLLIKFFSWLLGSKDKKDDKES